MTTVEDFRQALTVIGDAVTYGPFWHYAYITLQCVFWTVMLVNIKGLPFAWTIRFFYSAVTHLGFGKNNLPASDSLFEPTIYKMLPTTPADLDFNMHKCNSSYFIDLDIARCDLLLSKFKAVVNASRKTKRTVFIPLGGVACRFYAEIKPLEVVRIESRVLCWDEKWIFTLSRFIGRNEQIKAVSMARYVFKNGRKTIKPEDILRDCGFVANELENARGLEVAQSLLDMDRWISAWDRQSFDEKQHT